MRKEVASWKLMTPLSDNLLLAGRPLRLPGTLLTLTDPVKFAALGLRNY